jgi:hypothetical protein
LKASSLSVIIHVAFGQQQVNSQVIQIESMYTIRPLLYWLFYRCDVLLIRYDLYVVFLQGDHLVQNVFPCKILELEELYLKSGSLKIRLVLTFNSSWSYVWISHDLLMGNLLLSGNQMWDEWVYGHGEQKRQKKKVHKIIL